MAIPSLTALSRPHILVVPRILVLHKGKVRESGTHQELLALGGLYFRLWETRPIGEPVPLGPVPDAVP